MNVSPIRALTEVGEELPVSRRTWVARFVPCGTARIPPRRGLVRQAQGNALGTEDAHAAVSPAQRANRSVEEPLGRWPDKQSALHTRSPGRCPGLGEPRAFGPADEQKPQPRRRQVCATPASMMALLLLAVALALPDAARAAAPNTLTPEELADGWILLFDGETLFGWTAGEQGRLEGRPTA